MEAVIPGYILYIIHKRCVRQNIAVFIDLVHCVFKC
ncbi:hypothetical protein X975_12019, partial [Stegodyphus mimosarum]